MRCPSREIVAPPFGDTRYRCIDAPGGGDGLHIYQRYIIPLEAGMASVRKDKEMKINMCVFV